MHDDPLETFREEARELLAELEESLLGLEDDPANRDLVDAAFRSLHTIKGSGTMFDLPELVTFAHTMEAVFDRVRAGEVPLTSNLISLALRAKDHLEALLFTPEAEGLHAHGEELLAVLDRVVPGESARKTSPAEPQPTDDRSEPDVPESDPPDTFHISFVPSRDYFRNGGNPLAIFEELRDLGEARITADLDEMPPVSEMEPDGCYLRWEIEITTSASLEDVRDCFMFVPDAVTIRREGLPQKGEP
ncbi:MAG: Hpt domain-containing protein, partial [Alkalispirochaeta sp.]